jgi:Fe-S-cluster-containing dehydrogenase component
MTFEYRLDISRCIGCKACEVACVTANDLDPRSARNWVPHLEDDEVTNGNTTFAPYLCHQCADAPCVDACPTGASYKAADGRVLVDHDLCIGCGLCVPACPYAARYVAEDIHKIEKCTLCESRVKNGLAPACFEVCPSGARTFREIVEIDGVERTISVGDVALLDEGHEELQLVSASVNPHPTLRFSGTPEDLALLAAKRPPHSNESRTQMVWRNGAGKTVGALGIASMAVMGAMVWLRVVRDRKTEVALAAGGPAAGREEDGHE